MAINRKSAEAASTRRLCVGSLAAHIDKFAESLAGEGYVSQTAKAKCALVADLSHWLKQRGVSLAQLDEARLKQFHTHRRGSGRRGDVSTGHQLLEHLRCLGVVPALPQKVDRSAQGQLTRDYESFLSSERGLAPATLVSYLPIVRRFLTAHFGNKALGLQDLQPQDLHRFILHQVPRCSRTYSKLMVTALRSFLRFLCQRGIIETDLASALFGVAHWRLSHLPKSLPPDQVERLLRCCDRSTASGQRDYAILLLLYRFHSDLNRRVTRRFGAELGFPTGPGCDSLKPSDLIRRGPDGEVQQQPIEAVEASAETREKSDDAGAYPDGVTARKWDDAASDCRSNGGFSKHGEPGPYGI